MNFRDKINMLDKKIDKALCKLDVKEKCPICGSTRILSGHASDPQEYGDEDMHYRCEDCNFSLWGKGLYIDYILRKLQLTRSNIEKMVKLEWRDNRPMVADCGDFSLNIFYMKENEYTIYASKGILGGEMYIGTTKSEDEAKQKAKYWIVDIICSALCVEEEK